MIVDPDSETGVTVFGNDKGVRYNADGTTSLNPYMFIEPDTFNKYYIGEFNLANANLSAIYNSNPYSYRPELYYKWYCDIYYMTYSLKQAGIEASEEFATEVANTISDSIIMGDLSNYNLSVQSYIAQGMSEEEARKHANIDVAKNIGMAALGGAVSGGVMSGIFNGEQYAGNKQTQKAANAKLEQIYSGNATQSDLESVVTDGALRSAFEKKSGITLTGSGEEQVQQIKAEINKVKEGESFTDDEFNKLTSEKSTGLEFRSMSEYTPKQRATIKEFINSVDTRIKSAVEEYRANKNAPFKRLKISDVSQREVNDIHNLLGLTTYGYTHNINTNAFEHIENRHGTNGEADSTMSDSSDVARIGYVLENYDTVEQALDQNGNPVYTSAYPGSDNKPAPVIKYSKRIDGTMYVAEAVAPNKWNKIWVTTAYVNKKDAVTRAPHAVNSQEHTSKNALASPTSSNTNVTQNTNGVKDNIRNKGQKNAAIDKAADKYDGKTAREFKNAYEKTDMPAEIYSDLFNEAYVYSEAGFTENQIERIMKRSAGYSDFKASGALKAASRAGNEVYKKQLSDKSARIEMQKDGDTRKARGSYTNSSKAKIDLDHVRVLRAFANTYGLNIEIVDSIADDTANGVYISGNNIQLSANALDNALPAYALHEAYHYVKEWNPTAAQDIQSFIIDELLKDPEFDFKARVEQIKSRYETDYAGAVEELCANSLMSLTANKDFVERFVREGDKTTVQKFVDGMKNVIAKLRKMLASIAGRYGEVSVLKENQKALNKLADMVDSALKQTRENYSGTNDIDNQAKYSINPKFEEEYDSWDKKTSGGYFRIGTTSDALMSIGVNPSKIYWDKAKILKIKNKHTEMTDSIIKQVPNILEKPIIIMQSKTVTNRVTMFGELVDDSGKPVLAALELKPNGRIQDFIKVASVYSRGAQNLIDTSEILYIDPNKNRTDSWFQALRLQLPTGVTNYGSIGRVTYVDKNVKGEISFGNKGGKTAMQAAFEAAEKENSTQDNISQKGNKYSLKETSEIDSKQLLEENEKLKKINENLRQEFKLTKGHKVSQKAVEKVARSMLREYNSDYDLQQLKKNITYVFEYIANDKDVTMESAVKALSTVTKAVIEQSSVLDKT